VIPTILRIHIHNYAVSFKIAAAFYHGFARKKVKRLSHFKYLRGNTLPASYELCRPGLDKLQVLNG
jgi:hypothetical protein